MHSKFKRNLRLFFKLNVIVVSILSCLIAINSSFILEFKDLPEENFVNLMITSHLLENIENCVNDTGSPFDQCQTEVILMEGLASGLAFKSDEEFTYILTADHFCRPNIELLEKLYPDNTLAIDLWATTTSGESWSAEIVSSNRMLDLCLLRSAFPLSSDISVSDNMPEKGEKVYAISAPQGIQESNVAFHFEGSFSGCQSINNCFFTLPSASGSSGGVILDKRGRIVGMIQKTLIGFEHISIGTGAMGIQLFLSETSEQTGIEF